MAQSRYGSDDFAAPNGVNQRSAPGGMNNGVSPGDQRGLSPYGAGDFREGRASAMDDDQSRVNHHNAPGGMNNGLSPAIQHGY